MAVKKKKAAGSEAPKPVAVKLVVVITPDTPNYYVNHVEISHTPHEFCLAVARLPPKLGETHQQELAKSGSITLDATLAVTVPPTLLPGLILALQTQQAAYESNFGKIDKSTQETTNDLAGKSRVH